MAFADPISFLVSGTATNLPRISSGDNRSVYQTNDGNMRLTLSTQYGARIRHMARFDFTKVAADPFTTGANLPFGMSAYLVVDAPKIGFTVAELRGLVDGLTVWQSENTSANITKLLGGES